MLTAACFLPIVFRSTKLWANVGMLGNLVEFLPVFAFFTAYFVAGKDIYIATYSLLAMTAVSVFISYFFLKKVSPALIIGASVISILGGLTIWLQNPVFIQMKPTIVNGSFAIILTLSLLFRRNVLAYCFGQFLDMVPRGWYVLTWRWVVFLFAVGGLNEIVWRNFPEDVWVNVKVFGYPSLFLVFSAFQYPLICKYSTISEDPPEDPPEDSTEESDA